MTLLFMALGLACFAALFGLTEALDSSKGDEERFGP
jgi:hypothetical protein